MSQADSPIDFFDAALSTALGQGLVTLLALPAALRDAGAALVRLSSETNIGLFQTLIIACATLGGFVLARRMTARARLRAEALPMPFSALLRQAGYELAALAVAVVIGRVLLVRWLNIPSGSAIFPAEAIIALVRWLFAMAVARFFSSLPLLRSAF